MPPTKSRHADAALRGSQIRRFLYRTIPAVRPGSSVGVEQEFFLTSHCGAPASEELSQAVLRHLVRGGLRPLKSADARFLVGAQLSDNPTMPTRIGYDHPPHLLEISSSPHSSLGALERNLAETWERLVEAVGLEGARLESRPLLEMPADDGRLQSPRRMWADLRYYRSLLLGTANCAFANYAAVIAATQVHIAVSPLTHAEVIERLYRLEPHVFLLTSRWAGLELSKVRQRWQGYATVFAKSPLVGFPRLNAWSVEGWIQALYRTPMAGGPKDWWAGQTLEDSGQLPRHSVAYFWRTVRDLQIIRPRLWGTIEFRGDPAMPSVSIVMRVAALRLGLTLAALHGFEPPLTFPEANHLWWRMSLGELTPEVPDLDISSVASEALEKQMPGAERYLNI